MIQLDQIDKNPNNKPTANAPSPGEKSITVPKKPTFDTFCTVKFSQIIINNHITGTIQLSIILITRIIRLISNLSKKGSAKTSQITIKLANK